MIHGGWILVVVFSSGIVQVPGYSTKTECQAVIQSLPKKTAWLPISQKQTWIPEYESAMCIQAPQEPAMELPNPIFDPVRIEISTVTFRAEEEIR